MLHTRVIPVLLLKDNGLVKSVKFKKYKYIGDPINAVKIFNDKEVDELIFLDINASRNKTKPDLLLIEKIANECFMPVCYGGGVTTIKQMNEIFKLGIEKISINTAVLKNDKLISEAAEVFGSQSIVVSIDVKKNLLGQYKLYNHVLRRNIKNKIVEYIKYIERLGAGEILINSVDRDGTQMGYDLDLIKLISDNVNIPVIACGGAGNIQDFKKAKNHANVSALAAGSFFVFHGKHRAVMISYPKYEKLRQLFGEE